jgi:DedD protein
MVTRSETPDLAVDELKRRARRRLVGAIVLALAAAVLLPLLLESEPKPLGDEVSIQIPPVDNSKFVNPLSPVSKGGESKGSDAGTKKAVPSAAAQAVTSPPSATPPPGVGGDARPPPDTGSSATTAAPSAPAQPPSTDEKGSADSKPAASSSPPPSTPPAAPEPKKQSAVDSKAAAKQGTQTEPTPSGGAYVVQVAAYTDRYGALAQVRKLKRAGYPAYVESTATGKGDLQRVRVGPYTSRDTADAARAKLKSAGYDAIVARAR